MSACEAFLERTKTWGSGFQLIELHVYGDATGDSRRSSASRTDWQMVREFLGRHTDRFRASFEVPSSNPPVKDRTNCVNSMLRNQAGENRLFLHPRCRQLIRDLDQVHWNVDANGNPLTEIDKSDPMRTHTSDALGYMIAKKFDKSKNGGPMQTRII